MNEATEIWQRFARLPGATVDGVAGIASEHAIRGLIQAIRRHRPRRILELGAGIGTLTYTCLKEVRALRLDQADGFVFYSVENEPFCISQLARNLEDYADSYLRVDTTEALPSGQVFDLIVVDGGGDLDNDMGLMSFDGMLAEGGVIFVEGGRSFQRRLIEQWYCQRPHEHASVCAPYPTLEASEVGITAKNKGYHLFIFEPSYSDRLRLPLRAFWYKLRRRAHRTFQTR